MADSEAEEPPLLLPCAVCCRTFRPESLAKHAKICEKNATKRRKTFDSSKQRIQGTDLAEFLPILHAVKKTDKSPVKKTQSKWKEKHMEFVRAIRAARITDETRSGGPGTQIASAPPPRPMDHERCPHCDRFFGPKAFDRHVDWCKEQKCRIPKSPASLLAKERWEARIKYRAPSMNRSKRSMTREKYLPASRKNSGGLERDPSPVIRSNSDSFTPSVMTTSAKRQGQDCASFVTAVSPSRKPAKESVSSPACNMKRNIAQRVSVRQRSASPKKSPLGLKSTTNRKVKASDPVEVNYSKESPLLEGKGDDNMSASYNISQIQCTGSNMTTPAADKNKRPPLDCPVCPHNLLHQAIKIIIIPSSSPPFLIGFCYNDGEEHNEAFEETVPAVYNWEDVGHDAGVYYEDFLNLDENLAICGELTDAEILADAMNNRNDNASSNEEGGQMELPEKPIPTYTHAMDHIEELR
uniref:C2HC/C3H-type domain-containing protein n=1 Tax=Timema cristinae TaxID=61476 RepID=A0A7R9CCP3_TIMCR|nr:unnamed protein product [Timema cristinae]